MTDLLPRVVCCAVGTLIACIFLRCPQIKRLRPTSQHEREHGLLRAVEVVSMQDHCPCF